MKIIRIVILLLLWVALIYGAYFSYNYEKEMSRVDLSEFTGRIFPNHQASYQGSVSINVSLNEAKRFKKQGILSFNNNLIEVWQPDGVTTGAFLYHKTEFKDGFWSSSIKLNGKNLVIYRVIGSAFLGLLFLCLLFMCVWSAFEFSFL